MINELKRKREALWNSLSEIQDSDLRDMKREREIRGSIKALQQKLYILEMLPAAMKLSADRSDEGLDKRIKKIAIIKNEFALLKSLGVLDDELMAPVVSQVEFILSFNPNTGEKI